MALISLFIFFSIYHILAFSQREVNNQDVNKHTDNAVSSSALKVYSKFVMDFRCCKAESLSL